MMNKPHIDFANAFSTVSFRGHSAPVFLLAALILGVEPVRWLVNTWLEPAYDSKGFYIFVACAALFMWSATSPRNRRQIPQQKKLALYLFAITALVRLAGQVLAVNTIGALALVIDVYALGLLFGLKDRARALSPGWLALAFAFSLPLERIAQRTIGYGLQSISSDGACLLLGSFFDDLKCFGVRLVLEGKDVLVDLPCSGARSILLLLLCFALVAVLVRPTIKQAVIGGGLTLLAGLLANMVRISLLAVGIARPQTFFGAEVMAQPWHDLIGLFTLALGALPLLLWAGRVVSTRRAPTIDERCRDFIPDRLVRDSWWLVEPKRSTIYKTKALPAFTFLAFALLIVNLPRQALDVARRSIAIELPGHIEGFAAQPVKLLAKERAYFIQYGGSAQKAFYGPHQLLMVRTSAPLRHLHAPDDCLRGLGMKVEYLGMRYTPIPSATYRATAKDGQAYRIDVSFVSDKGFITTNISQAVWRWIQNQASTWTAIQRITPLGVSEPSRQKFERGVMAALDLSAGNSLRE
ncbi:MAG: exosortase T [Hyphomicrobiaceae bacterium]|nr:exosortase T [Hyphomicrobiaceae bacterium]